MSQKMIIIGVAPVDEVLGGADGDQQQRAEAERDEAAADAGADHDLGGRYQESGRLGVGEAAEMGDGAHDHRPHHEAGGKPQQAARDRADHAAGDEYGIVLPVVAGGSVDHGEDAGLGSVHQPVPDRDGEHDRQDAQRMRERDRALLAARRDPYLRIAADGHEFASAHQHRVPVRSGRHYGPGRHLHADRRQVAVRLLDEGVGNARLDRERRAAHLARAEDHPLHCPRVERIRLVNHRLETTL